MLLVHHDERKLPETRKRSHPGSDQNPCPAFMNSQPGSRPLRVRQVRVQHNNGFIREMASDAFFKLRCQIDFRDQQKHLILRRLL
ncbi:unknown [Sutterella sp. CAG:351]|nr:unknown [Sutterella sp. CAG:351]